MPATPNGLVSPSPLETAQVRTGSADGFSRSRENRDAHGVSRGYNGDAESVFDGAVNSEDVYDGSGARDIVDSVCSGLNGTIFVYGQTGTGKTYTIDHFTKYAVEQVIDFARKKVEGQVAIFVSVIELYNEVVRDLLSGQDNLSLRLLDDNSGVVIDELREEAVDDKEELLKLVERAKAARVVSATQANERSSRSHLILRLKVEVVNDAPVAGFGGSVMWSCLNLVDLAGSERVSKTGSDKHSKSLKEATTINRDLLCLGNVISALAERQEGKKQPYIPYRNSKLTRILQDALGGNGRTALVACITKLSGWNLEQTKHTLEFASRSAHVVCAPRVNVAQLPSNHQSELQWYQSEIERLQQLLQDHRDREGKGEPAGAAVSQDLGSSGRGSGSGVETFAFASSSNALPPSESAVEEGKADSGGKGTKSGRHRAKQLSYDDEGFLVTPPVGTMPGGGSKVFNLMINSLKDKKDEYGRLKGQLRSVQDRMRQMSEEVSAKNMRVNELERRVELMTSEKELEVLKWKGRVAQLEAEKNQELSTREQQLRTVEASLQAAKDEADSYRTQMHALQSQMESAGVEAQKYNEQLRANQSMAASLASSNTVKESVLQNQQSLLLTMSRRIHNLQDQLAQTEAEKGWLQKQQALATGGDATTPVIGELHLRPNLTLMSPASTAGEGAATEPSSVASGMRSDSRVSCRHSVSQISQPEVFMRVGTRAYLKDLGALSREMEAVQERSNRLQETVSELRREGPDVEGRGALDIHLAVVEEIKEKEAGLVSLVSRIMDKTRHVSDVMANLAISASTELLADEKAGTGMAAAQEWDGLNKLTDSICAESADDQTNQLLDYIHKLKAKVVALQTEIGVQESEAQMREETAKKLCTSLREAQERVSSQQEKLDELEEAVDVLQKENNSLFNQLCDRVMVEGASEELAGTSDSGKTPRGLQLDTTEWHSTSSFRPQPATPHSPNTLPSLPSAAAAIASAGSGRGTLPSAGEDGLEPVAGPATSRPFTMPSGPSVTVSKPIRDFHDQILVLWDALYVPFWHRSNFYGQGAAGEQFPSPWRNPQYCNAELHRLKWLQVKFSKDLPVRDRAQQTLESEKKLLSNAIGYMNRQARQALYQDWSIDFSSKNRRIQLMDKLWQPRSSAQKSASSFFGILRSPATQRVAALAMAREVHPVAFESVYAMAISRTWTRGNADTIPAGHATAPKDLRLQTGPAMLSALGGLPSPTWWTGASPGKQPLHSTSDGSSTKA